MRIPAGSIVTAWALSVALLVAGCARPGVKEARVGEQVYLLPAVAQGPDPFTGSTVTATAAPAVPGRASADPRAPAHTGTAEPTATATGPPGSASPRSALRAAFLVAPLRAMRVLSGATPGLYGGTAHVADCDVERQIGYLAADRSRGAAFARAAGVSVGGLPGYLHGLTPVVLRADTWVTNHGYRDGQPVGYQAVLQAGTAVLVDNRGLPRVRCGCGNPLGSPAPARGGFGARGSAWSGYRPDQVIAVAPAARAVTSITIVNAETRTWIERRIGRDVRDDQIVPAPAGATTAVPDGSPDPADTAPTATAPPYLTLPSPQQTPPGSSPGTAGRPPAAATPTPPDGSAGPSGPAPGVTDPQPLPSSLDLTPDAPDDLPSGVPVTPGGIPPSAPDAPDEIGPLDEVGPLDTPGPTDAAEDLPAG
ncbi:DUF6777 domain-containing protein [Streptomyces sp. NPDC001709]